MSRGVKRAIHNIVGSTGACLPVQGSKELLIDRDHQDHLTSTMRLIEEGVPGTLAEMLEESCKGSFNILRG